MVYYVASLSTWVLVRATSAEIARALGQAKIRQMIGHDAVQVRTIRPATAEEMDDSNVIV